MSRQGSPTFRFNVPIGQWADIEGTLYRFKGRARDAGRRLVFEDMDGIPKDMTDADLLAMQQGGGNVRLLTPGEASDRLDGAGKPHVKMSPLAPEIGDDVRRKLDYIRAWERAGFPPRTVDAMKPVVTGEWERRRATPEPASKILEMAAPSPRQVLRWIADWIDSGGDVQVLVVQTANCGNETDRLLPVARELLDRTVGKYYLVDTRPTAVAVHYHVKKAFKEYNAPLPAPERLSVPSLDAVYRVVRGIDGHTLDYTRIGPRTASRKWRTVTTGPIAVKHNEVWETDHTWVDLIVIDGGTGMPIGRPLVTATIDRHSRIVTGFYIGFDAPGTYAAMECLRVAIAPKDGLLAQYSDIVGPWPCMGTPKTLVTDQGKEFKSRAFVEACLTLGIDIQYTPVLKAWYKGRIERFFRTLSTDVFKRVPGTTFSDIFERNKEKAPETVAVATIDELRHITLRYVVDVYNRRRHRGLA